MNLARMTFEKVVTFQYSASQQKELVLLVQNGGRSLELKFGGMAQRHGNGIGTGNDCNCKVTYQRLL